MFRISPSYLLLSIALLTSECFCQEKYALVVGVETYDTGFFSNLKYAEEDALSVSNALKRLGFQTLEMTSQSENSRFKPTSARKIKKVLSTLLASLGDKDTLIVSFSGHGVQFKDEEKLPTGILETYFCPEDADLEDKESLLPISDVIQQIEDSRAVRKLVFLDACRNQILSKKAAPKTNKRIELESVHESRHSISGGMSVFFSCKSNQFSWEDESLKHSVFSSYLIQFLEGRAPKKYYDENVIDLNGIVRYVSKATNDHVLNEGLSADGQIPVLRGSASNWKVGISTESYFKKIREQIKLRDYQLAMKICERTEQKIGFDPELYYLSIDALCHAGKVDLAKNKLQDLENRAANSTPHLLGAAIVYYYLAETSFSDKEMRLSESFARKAYLSDKDNFDTLLWYSWAKMVQGQAPEIEVMIDDFLKRNPENAVALREKANWIQESEPEQAIALLNKSIAIDPEDPVSRNYKGNIYLRLERYSLALPVFEEAVRIAPAFVNLYQQKARAFEGLKRLDEAELAYGKAVEMSRDPGTKSLHLTTRAVFFSNQDKHDLADRDFLEAIRLTPRKVDARVHRAESYIKRGKYDSALRDSTEAIKIDPVNARPYQVRCRVYLSQGGRSNDALRDINKAIELTLSKFPEQVAYNSFLKAFALLQNGDKTSARRYFELASEKTKNKQFQETIRNAIRDSQ